MSNLAIKVENLSKLYKIGVQKNRHDTLRDHLVHGIKSLFSRNGEIPSGSPQFTAGSGQSSTVHGRTSRDDFIWALKEVSFEIQEGEVVGFIGKNGAGKSTLLKILSRITEPTTGRIEIAGRVGSLLEVGTGFHPELSGRENIYLSGAILGMKNGEINHRFDEIVAFSEVERFIDTPVKRYSSGMYVRLAFAVAAHLQPEILIVDEVLAVGDAAFQNKCLNKMQEIRQSGRTVLFVSHNTSAVVRLCNRCVLLQQGRVVGMGPSHETVGQYLEADIGLTSIKNWTTVQAPGNEVVRLLQVRVRSPEGETIESLDIRRPVGIEMEFEVLQSDHVLVPNYHFFNPEGVCVFVACDTDPCWRRKIRPVGRYLTTGWIPGNFLAEGTIVVGAAISTHDPVMVHCFEKRAVAFHVVDSLDGDSARGDYKGPVPGAVRPMLRWETQSVEGLATRARIVRSKS